MQYIHWRLFSDTSLFGLLCIPLAPPRGPEREVCRRRAPRRRWARRSRRSEAAAAAASAPPYAPPPEPADALDPDASKPCRRSKEVEVIVSACESALWRTEREAKTGTKEEVGELHTSMTSLTAVKKMKRREMLLMN